MHYLGDADEDVKITAASGPHVLVRFVANQEHDMTLATHLHGRPQTTLGTTLSLRWQSVPHLNHDVPCLLGPATPAPVIDKKDDADPGACINIYRKQAHPVVDLVEETLSAAMLCLECVSSVLLLCVHQMMFPLERHLPAPSQREALKPSSETTCSIHNRTARVLL